MLGVSAVNRSRRDTVVLLGALACLALVLLWLWGPDERSYIDTRDAVTHAAPAVTVGAAVTNAPPAESIAADAPVAPTEYAQVNGEGTVKRLETIAGDPQPAPIRWGLNGSSIPGRCTQVEPLLADLAPPGGWAVERISGFMERESGCCPQVLDGDRWRTTQGGDRFDGDCLLLYVAERNHRSDAGLLQINGINYDPARCANTCLSDWLNTPVTLATLGDPALNIRAAARLCEFWMNAGSSCYRPWN